MSILSLVTALSVSIALGTSAILSSTMAAPSTKPHQATLQEEYKKPPSFLFVLQAKEATLQPIKGELYRYTLSMKLNDDNVSKIIAFSDRPYRIVETMTAKQLKDLWGEGTNSFKADPPNAVLSANEVDASIVIIEGILLEKNIITFNLVYSVQRMESKPLKVSQSLTGLLLTVDGGGVYDSWCKKVRRANGVYVMECFSSA